ncbi:MAG: ferrochelatase, partial [Flavobacteriia bacterium]|nr:ferrochelatase [Flavobacteriia bacterium]
MKKKAVILFNLGGPDDLQSVGPFLFNLFSDPAILSVPSIIRPFLARFIAWRRTPTAQEVYRHLGGKSPLLEQTNMQAEDLEKTLKGHDAGWRVFVAMRYWHPMVPQVVASVKAFSPDEILLVPLYPQYSSATSG